MSTFPTAQPIVNFNTAPFQNELISVKKKCSITGGPGGVTGASKPYGMLSYADRSLLKRAKISTCTNGNENNLDTFHAQY
jgi:hypothetical protein